MITNDLITGIKLRTLIAECIYQGALVIYTKDDVPLCYDRVAYVALYIDAGLNRQKPFEFEIPFVNKHVAFTTSISTKFYSRKRLITAGYNVLFPIVIYIRHSYCIYRVPLCVHRQLVYREPAVIVLKNNTFHFRSAVTRGI